MLRLPRPGRRARLAGLGTGAALLLWLSVEDNHVWPAALLGAALAVLLVTLTLLHHLGGRDLPARRVVPGAALLGVAAGLAASIVAAGLMLFKNAMHAHLFPDYPPGLLLAILERAPVWAVAGGLAGLGLAFGWLWWQQRQQK